MKEFVTLGTPPEPITTVISKSRFIARAQRADTAEEAAAFVAETAKKYFDATHNCYAYIAGGAVKFSDDGEPGGTAGMPILDAIKKQNLGNVCVVVTRYFGGTKLGAGGLVRAYSGAAGGILSAAQKIKIRAVTPLEITVPYGLLKTVQAHAEKTAKVVSAEYAGSVKLKIYVPAADANDFTAAVTNLTNGQAKIAVGAEFLGEY